MTDITKDAGLIQVLAKRVETQRLPRALSLKDKVDTVFLAYLVYSFLMHEVFAFHVLTNYMKRKT